MGFPVRARIAPFAGLLAVVWVLVAAGCDDGKAKVQASSTSNTNCSGLPSNGYCVNSATGSDSNKGTAAAPFKTIMHALSIIASGGLVQVEPGQYDAASGETFPIYVPAGVTLAGDLAHKGLGSTATTITGTGLVLSPAALSDPNSGNPIESVVVPGIASTIEGFDIVALASTAPDEGSVIAVQAGPVFVEDNTLDGNLNAYVDVFDLTTGSNEYIGNEMKNPGSFAFYSNNQTSPTTGDVFQGNVFNGGASAVYLYDTSTSVFDFGGGPGSNASTGGNTFCGFADFGLTHTLGSSANIYATGNAWLHDPPTTGVVVVTTPIDIYVPATLPPTLTITSSLAAVTTCP